VRILHVNKFLYRRGGAEAYMLDLAALQEAAGHTTATFGMQHPQNPPHRYQAHLPPYLELNPPPAGLGARARAAGRMLWSPDAAAGLARVVADFHPDVVHLHNIYEHLSPSVLRPVLRAKVPMVMTLHDYKLVCPTYQLLAAGSPCEACLGGGFHNAVQRRCKNGSAVHSAVAAVETAAHRWTGAYRPVARFICPSRFMATKMRDAGVFPDRLVVVPHFAEVATVATKVQAGGDVLFAGRLSPEKGVDTLIEAVGLASPAVRVVIAGDGPERPRLEALAERLAPGRVHFLGQIAKAALHDRIRASGLVAVPSRWYENQPMIVLEAFACGVPVVATTLGGLPELVEPGVDGFLVPPDDPAALAATLTRARDDVLLLLSLGAAARRKAERLFAPDRHVEAILATYAEAGAAAPVAAGGRR
jgi:glycosyltransferase involved in cell wall biosynthesis